MREELKYWIGYLCWLGEGAIRFAGVMALVSLFDK